MKQLSGVLIGLAALCGIIAGIAKLTGAGLYFHGGGWSWLRLAEIALLASIAISLLQDKK